MSGNRAPKSGFAAEAQRKVSRKKILFFLSENSFLLNALRLFFFIVVVAVVDFVF